MVEYKDRQFISRDVLYDAGYSPYKVNKLVETGELIAVNRKFFENPDYDGEINDYYCVNAYASRGVICLISAAIYHDLTTNRPIHIDVALPRRSRVPRSPDWPETRFYLFSEERYAAGVVAVEENGNHFMIYDREKTVCDVLFYRNKLGFEPALEVLKNYLGRRDRDLNKLMRYAKKLRCGKLLQGYLEIMI